MTIYISLLFVPSLQSTAQLIEKQNTAIVISFKGEEHTKGPESGHNNKFTLNLEKRVTNKQTNLDPEKIHFIQLLSNSRKSTNHYQSNFWIA